MTTQETKASLLKKPCRMPVQGKYPSVVYAGRILQVSPLVISSEYQASCPMGLYAISLHLVCCLKIDLFKKTSCSAVISSIRDCHAVCWKLQHTQYGVIIMSSQQMIDCLFFFLSQKVGDRFSHSVIRKSGRLYDVLLMSCHFSSNPIIV